MRCWLISDNPGICIVYPLSTKVKNYKGCLVLKKDASNGLDHDSEVITFQVRTISGERLMSKVGMITRQQLDVLKNGLLEILTY